MDDGRMTPELLNQGFLDAEQYISPVLANVSRTYANIWRNRIPRGVFTYGEGYTKKSRQFHGGQALQGENRGWETMQPSRAPDPATGDPGYDACRYDAQVVGYGIEEKQYTIYQTTRRTTDVCLTDILFKWQFQQQLKAMFGMLSNVSLGEWENWLREMYVNFATKIVSLPGMPQVDISMGADEIDMSAFDLSDIGQLDQSILDRLYMYMYRQCPMAALAKENGMPVYGLVTSAETQKELITHNSQAVENFQYAKPGVLIEGLGNAMTYKGFAHVADPMSMRFRVKHDDPTKLERVWPYEFEPTTVGDAVNVSQEYVDAPFELSVIFLQDVFKSLVPPANPTTIGGHQFGAQDNMGEFKWINIQDREDNLLNEKGFYFGRYRAAPEPLQYSDDAVCILHRRCTDIELTLCNTGDLSSSSAENITSIANYDDDATTNTMVVVTLASSIEEGIGDSVTVTDGDNDTHTAIIVDDSGDGQYILDFGVVVDGDEDDWAAEILDGATQETVG